MANDMNFGNQIFIFGIFNESLSIRKDLRFPQKNWMHERQFSWMISLSFELLERRHSVLS
jgi:hypothetical protein